MAKKTEQSPAEKAFDDLEHLVNVMVATVDKGGTIAGTELVELQRRVGVARAASPKPAPVKEEKAAHTDEAATE